MREHANSHAWATLAMLGVACACTAPATASKPRHGAPTDDWYREVLDPAVMMASSVSIAVRSDAVSVVTTPLMPEQQSLQFRLVGGLWQTRILQETSTLIDSTTGRDDVSWLLLQSPSGIAASRAGSGRVEILSAGRATVLAHGMTMDRGGAPHVCFSVLDGGPPVELVYATRTVPGSGTSAWKLERLPVAALSCQLAATEQGIFIVASGESGVFVLSKLAGTAWTIKQLSSAPAQIAAARGLSGLAVLAFASNAEVTLLHVSDAHQRSSRMPLATSLRDPSTLAIAIDSTDRVHVALAMHDEAGPGELLYASERGRTTTLIARDFVETLALGLDGDGQPHLTYVVSGPETRRHELIYARLRTPKDRDLPPREYLQDPRLLLGRCAMIIAGQVGAVLDPAEAQRADRWCGKFSSELPPIAKLVEHCEAGIVDACIVAGARAGMLHVVARRELVLDCATSTNPSCHTSLTTETGLANQLGNGRDDVLARTVLAKACRMGSKPACYIVAMQETDARRAGELLAKVCSPELPLACAVALDKLDLRSPATDTTLVQVRNTLAAACPSSVKPEACNALAFMEEAGLGGPPGADALAHHARACELGSPTSCSRLLLGPFPRPTVPSTLNRQQFEKTLSAACTNGDYEPACRALARALELGWAVDRDVAKARRFLDHACQLGAKTACDKRTQP